MKNEHIINLIESTSLVSISESDLTEIRAHNAGCADCRRAFEAAQISALLLRQRAAETIEPSAFFHTRVLASLRERQTATDSWAWTRVWRAAGALASSMVATVAALAVLTFIVPENQVSSGEVSALPASYTAEEVILNQSESPEQTSDDQVSDGQLLTSIYGGEE
jgi:anti-sigma-K factor RskA